MYKGLENNAMDEALVIWFKNCCEDPKQIKSLDQILAEENVKHVYKLIIAGHVEDYTDKDIANPDNRHYLEILLNQIIAFYGKYLNQTLTRLPNIENIIADPTENFADTHLLLLLLIGCATQCHEKFWFYEKIAQLDTVNFFRVIAHLKKLRELIQEKKPTAPVKNRESSIFHRYFNRSFNFGNKQATLLTNSVNHRKSASVDDTRSWFNCRDECPFSPIYQIKIQKDQMKQSYANDKIRKLEAQVKQQNEYIDTLKRDYEAKLNKQGRIIATFAKDNIQISGTKDEKAKWALMDDKTKTEAELLYKIEMYNNLLNEVAKEWSKEEVKYKQLSDEISRIKRLIYFDSTKQASQQMNNNNKKQENNKKRHSAIELMNNSAKEIDNLNCLDLNNTNVTHLIELFENKNTSQHHKVLEIKNKIFATKNDEHDDISYLNDLENGNEM